MKTSDIASSRTRPFGVFNDHYRQKSRDFLDAALSVTTESAYPRISDKSSYEFPGDLVRSRYLDSKAGA